MENIQDLPAGVQEELTRFVQAAQGAWGEGLRAVVLYGSAAEGRLRATSDVNLLLVLRSFSREQAHAVRDAYRTARAAIRLGVMFIEEGELPLAMAAFAIKFDDILSRHRLLVGSDPFADLQIPRDAAIQRLRQVLLNLQLRLRERYALVSLREEQLAVVAAEYSGPLRSSAAALLRLEGQSVDNPKAALQQVADEMGDEGLGHALSLLSKVREAGTLDAGEAETLSLGLMTLVQHLQARAQRLG